MKKLLCITLIVLLAVSVLAGAVTVTGVYNAPNPFSTETTFHLVYSPTPYPFYSIAVKIYNFASQLVAQPNAQGTDEVTWDGRDFDGNLLANGMYLYKAYVYELVYGIPELFWQSSTKTLAILR